MHPFRHHPLANERMARVDQRHLARKAAADVLQCVAYLKRGHGLIHLPSGNYRVNQARMWSAPLTTNLSVFAHALGRVDTYGVRAHAKRARREMLCRPARVLFHTRAVVVNFAVAVAETAFSTA